MDIPCVLLSPGAQNACWNDRVAGEQCEIWSNLTRCLWCCLSCFFPWGKLKKTILEDREYRAPGPQPTLEPRNDQPIPVGLVAPPVTVEPFLPSWCVGEEEKTETEAIDDVQAVQDEEDEAQDDGNDEPEDQQEKEEKVTLIENEGRSG